MTPKTRRCINSNALPPNRVAIDRFRRKADRGIESEGAIGPDDVIVNRLWHADERHPELMKLVGDCQGPVTTDHHHRVQVQSLEGIEAHT